MAAAGPISPASRRMGLCSLPVYPLSDGLGRNVTAAAVSAPKPSVRCSTPRFDIVGALAATEGKESTSNNLMGLDGLVEHGNDLVSPRRSWLFDVSGT